MGACSRVLACVIAGKTWHKTLKTRCNRRHRTDTVSTRFLPSYVVSVSFTMHPLSTMYPSRRTKEKGLFTSRATLKTVW